MSDDLRALAEEARAAAFAEVCDQLAEAIGEVETLREERDALLRDLEAPWTMRDERDRALADRDIWHKIAKDEGARLEAARDERDRYREALEPFGQYAAIFAHQPDDVPDFTTGVVTLSDLRAAARVLDTVEANPEEEKP